MTATEYGLRRIIRLETTYIRKQGQGYRLYKGRLIPEADFQQATAMPERPFISVDNPCKKHQYLNVEGDCIANLEKLISCEQ